MLRVHLKEIFSTFVFLGHEDRHIRFYDHNTGQMVHSMVAHLDSVTSLAVDQHGLYLISGSHDCSIRYRNYFQNIYDINVFMILDFGTLRVRLVCRR